MAHYDVTYACGHIGTVELFGRVRDRERKIAWLETTKCPDCTQKEAEARLQAFEEEYELPEIKGSPKQIEWGRSIRKTVMENLSNNADNWFKKGDTDKQQDVLNIINMFASQDTARFWIDNRTMESILDMEKTYQRLLNNQNKLAEDARREAIIIPEGEKRSDGAVVVEIVGNVVSIEFHKDNEFNAIAKENGFEWYVDSFKWKRTALPVTTLEDQAGEIAHYLLKAGFSCCILNDVAREKAISGNFKPAGTRILHATQDAFVFRLLNRKDKDLDKIFARLRKIGGRRTYNEARVKSTMYRAVGDIASEYGFNISGEAKILIESQIQREITVSVGNHIEPEKIERISRKIIESNDPLADLLDDD